MHASTAPWWRDAVFYEIYIRSFADGNGDGVGDLLGVRSRLQYLCDLGVDAIWLTPFYTSPMADHGYDVADYRAVDPLFGDLAQIDALLAAARERGLRVIVDLVPNHTSDQHEWFREALAAGPRSPERERYMFRPGRGASGELPPNNWTSRFGGPAWERVTEPDGQPGEWYLHLFAPEQPDLNWRNPEVVEEFDDVLRFWLDRGVDGFRIDVAHGLFKEPGLPDTENGLHPSMLGYVGPSPMWNQPEVHGVYRRWRRILDSYDDSRMAVAEAWAQDSEDLARYVRPDELNQAFNFAFLQAPWSAAALRDVVNESIQATAGVGAATTWVLSNHDVARHVTRYGDGELGRRRARAALLFMLALPGSVYLYQGEELGLPEVADLPEEALADPIWERSGHTERGRDGCRVPLPWSGTQPPYGFTSEDVQPWLPMPECWSTLTVAAQSEDPDSMLSLYRTALRARKDHPALGNGTLHWLEACRDGWSGGESGTQGPHALAFAREPGLVCAINCGDTPVALPEHQGMLLASEHLDNDKLPPNTAVWLTR